MVSVTVRGDESLFLNFSGRPYDSEGKFLPEGALPPDSESSSNWDPYTSRLQFEVADFLYMCHGTLLLTPWDGHMPGGFPFLFHFLSYFSLILVWTLILALL